MNPPKYKLFVDDERFPPNDGEFWIIARTITEVQSAIQHNGFPKFISWDHDLGEDQPSGYDIAKWIVEEDLNDSIIPDDFDFYVHSQNPIGAGNIEGLLRQYLQVKKQLT